MNHQLASLCAWTEDGTNMANLRHEYDKLHRKSDDDEKTDNTEAINVVEEKIRNINSFYLRTIESKKKDKVSGKINIVKKKVFFLSLTINLP